MGLIPYWDQFHAINDIILFVGWVGKKINAKDVGFNID